LSARVSGLGSWARVIVLAISLTLSACEWFTDFKRQPSISTWEVVKDSLTPSRGSPQMSVPTVGTAVAGFQVSYGAFPATIDSMASLRNPTPATDSSLANGRKYFQINCAVCHGDRAMGDGPATKFGMPGINLATDMTKARTDGYIFGMIRNGRGLMPPYNRIEEMDRCHQLSESATGCERRHGNSWTARGSGRDRRQGSGAYQNGPDSTGSLFESTQCVDWGSAGNGCHTSRDDKCDTGGYASAHSF
jgi:mono/diheme cytochrome c family protein